MEKLKCINCQNHADYEMKCNIDNPNYNNLKSDLSKCFIKNDLHKALDKAIDSTEKLIDRLS